MVDRRKSKTRETVSLSSSNVSSQYGFKLLVMVCLLGTIIQVLLIGYGEDGDDGTSVHDNDQDSNTRTQENSDIMKSGGGPNTGEQDHQQNTGGRRSDHPLILWWNWKTINGKKLQECDNAKCWMASDRKYNKSAEMFIFYGTMIDFTDLPPPREAYQQWALLHEESPKNNMFMFSHPEIMEMFNYTSTFKRESDFPLTTVWLEDIENLEDNKYLVSTAEKNRLQREEGLALINFVQSNCRSYSGRNELVTMMQRELTVDSYGKCLHNKDLPEHLIGLKAMEHEDFIKLQAYYKFTFATENAICDDYMTEKLWRPLMAGSVPVVLGSPRVRDVLPTNQSAILVSDFKTSNELVAYLKYLNENDAEYEKYLSFKTKGGVTNSFLRADKASRKYGKLGIRHAGSKPHYSNAFACYLCERLHERRRREDAGEDLIRHQADVSHYGCPKPQRFADVPPGNLTTVDYSVSVWEESVAQAKAVQQLREERTSFSRTELDARAKWIRNNKQNDIN